METSFLTETQKKNFKKIGKKVWMSFPTIQKVPTQRSLFLNKLIYYVFIIGKNNTYFKI